MFDARHLVVQGLFDADGVSCPSLQVWQSSDSVVNVCSQLDWKRCVAVHLWFMLPPTASVADALAKYEAAFQVSCFPSLCSLSFHMVFILKAIQFKQTSFYSFHLVTRGNMPSLGRCWFYILLLTSTDHLFLSILQGTCEGGKYACAPLPPYLEAEEPDMDDEEEEDEESSPSSKRPLYDLCFHLLKLYSDR